VLIHTDKAGNKFKAKVCYKSRVQVGYESKHRDMMEWSITLFAAKSQLHEQSARESRLCDAGCNLVYAFIVYVPKKRSRSQTAHKQLQC
jgi:hypothetical protein